MQKYPHIIESYACILNIFALIFLLLPTAEPSSLECSSLERINLLISLGICSMPKLSK